MTMNGYCHPLMMVVDPPYKLGEMGLDLA